MTAKEHELKTICKFLALSGKKITDRHGHIFDENGYLDGGTQPAIESASGYVEYRQKGVLHRKGLPAIYDLASGVQEYWEEGTLMSVYKEHE